MNCKCNCTAAHFHKLAPVDIYFPDPLWKNTASWGVWEFKRHSSVVPSEQSKSDISEIKVPNYRSSTFGHITFLNILQVCAHCLNYPLGCCKLGADNKHWILRFGTVGIRAVKGTAMRRSTRDVSKVTQFQCLSFARFRDVAIISAYFHRKTN